GDCSVYYAGIVGLFRRERQFSSRPLQYGSSGPRAHAICDRVDFVAKHRKEPQPAVENHDRLRPRRGRTTGAPRPPANQLNSAEVVSGRWLVKALLIVLAVAGLALYLTVCLLFYQGQWQFTFFPVQETTASLASAAAKSGLPITNVRFDTTEEGMEQLDGWWIPSTTTGASQPSAPSPAPSQMVLLFCPNGRTDLPENVDALKAFHALGIPVFAFDYRGFGASQKTHPSQQKAYADGIAAFDYLTGMRHIPPHRIVVYGAGLGAAVAATVAQQSPEIAGIILEDPQPSFTQEVKREQHIHLLPMWLVFQDRFDITHIVPRLPMPKLILVTPTVPEYAPGAAKLYASATAPKQSVEINTPRGVPVFTQPQWREAVSNFLNTLAAPSAEQ
ncbi:MAG: alpha/beta fold hydrolase, partial [Acidobacteriaceae bacterium]